MPIKILMPALSPTMTEGNLAKWLKKEGESIAAGEVIAEIETDKATMEFEATDEGVLGRILIPAGSENVKVNQPIAILLEEGEKLEAIAELAPSNGNTVTANLTPQTSEHKTTARKTLTINNPKATTAGQPMSNLAADQSPADKSQRIFASPLARRVAQHNDVNLQDVKGTGPHGRIIKADIDDYVTAPQKSAGASTRNLQSDAALPPYEEIKLSTMRKVIAKRLTEAKQIAPHFYLSIDVQLDALLALRKNINDALAEEQRISVNDFIIKACAMALKEVPAANASYADSHIRQYHSVDISLAVAIDGGLVTPVIRSAETKSLSEISATVKGLVKQARAGKLMPEDYQGGTFSLSNLGMYGIKSFSAILNPPQGCILAVGAGEQQAVVRNNQLTIATIMACTLSVDHRVVDGAVGAEFFQSFKKFAENPVLMLV